MVRNINGRRYDTATATLIGTWDNGEAGGLDYCAETLYRKRSGEYFLHGEGGPRSRYNKSAGNGNWAGSEQIIPLTYSAAVEWAEERLPAGVYDAEFGAVQEDDARTTISATIAATVYDIAKRRAAQENKPMSAIIEQALRAYCGG